MDKLDIQHRHVIKLIVRDRDQDGRAAVSDKLYPVISKGMPEELVKFERDNNQWYAKLTDEGQAVADAMAWL